jgi:2,4-dienoyl-CoA reductase-like NADH-dependent reductase (Old Yellow Enzyme family)
VSYPRLASFKTAEALRAYLQRSGIDLQFDAERATPGRSPLAAPLALDDVRVGNRFCILPMEGWDGTRDGEPSDLTKRRWRHFGISGAKLIWGGEAVAVRPDGRANPNQLVMTPRTQPALAALRQELVRAHCERFGAGADDDLFVGLQLTHSGRFARPEVWNRPQPLAAVNDPILDRRFAAGVRVLTDDELDRLVEDFVRAAKLARSAGFRFVDLKQCHGYLGHELLGARARQGRYGGTLESRWRFLRSVVEGIRTEAPDVIIGVRLSVFDTVPYRKSEHGVGVPEDDPTNRDIGFGVLNGNLDAALEDSKATLAMLERLGIRWICTTAGSPYYNPHVQRPAFFPPLDGYEPPEDPLQGVARQIQATALLKAAFPHLIFVGSAYSYLQEWLPLVAQYVVRNKLVDFVGLGRVALSYPELPFDVLSGAPLRRQALCRTFSDCTTGPRMGLVSGCYPLDPFYARRPEGEQVKQVRTRINTESRKVEPF